MTVHENECNLIKNTFLLYMNVTRTVSLCAISPCFFFFISAIAFFLLPESGSAACKLVTSSSTYGKVTAPLLSLRSTPVRSHNLIQKLPKGREFILLDKNNNGWIHILDTSSCKKGWVSGNYVELRKKSEKKKKTLLPSLPAAKKCEIKNPTETFATVRSEWLNFRSRPETGKNIISKLLQNQKVMVLQQKSNGWIQVFDSTTCKKGWVSDNYVKFLKNPEKKKIIPLPSKPVAKKCEIKNPTDIFATITPKMLYLRSTPKMEKNIISKLLNEQIIMVLPKKSKNWIQVFDSTSCKKGWVVAKYVRLINKPVEVKVKGTISTPTAPQTPTPPPVAKKCEMKNPTDIFATITPKVLYLRSSPTMGKNIIAKLLKGQKIIVLPKKNKNWIQVFDAKSCTKGWVVEKYVELTNKTVKKKAKAKKVTPPPPTPSPSVKKKCEIKNPTDTFATITSEWLNFRKTPELGRNIIGKFLMGKKVMVLSVKNNGWIQVFDSTTCQKGWISKKHMRYTKKAIQKEVEPSPPPPVVKKCMAKNPTKSFATITPDVLYLRSTPERGLNIVTKLLMGQKIMILSGKKNEWIEVFDSSTCKTGWVDKKHVQLDTKVLKKKNTKPVSPLFLSGTMDESIRASLISAQERVKKRKERRKQKQKVELIEIPVSNCMKKLKTDIIGYGRSKPSSLNIIAEQNVNAKVEGKVSAGELLTIIETSIDWFSVVEEKTCTVGWVPRKMVTHISIEHPLNAGKVPVEPEPLTPCLIKLKRDNPIGFGVTAFWGLLYFEPRIPSTNDVASSLKKEQPLSIMRLEGDWLEVIEEKACITGWLPYGNVTDITFVRP